MTDKIIEQLDRIESQTLLAAKDVFNIDDVCMYTGFSKGFVYRLTHERRIPFYKSGGKMLFFRRNEINDWLCKHRTATNEEIESAAAAYVVNHPVRKGGRR